MTKYYRGTNPEHAVFWVKYRELPHEERFVAYVGFFRQLEQQIANRECNLKDAGYALEPSYYDSDIQADPQGGDMIADLQNNRSNATI